MAIGGAQHGLEAAMWCEVMQMVVRRLESLKSAYIAFVRFCRTFMHGFHLLFLRFSNFARSSKTKDFYAWNFKTVKNKGLLCVESVWDSALSESLKTKDFYAWNFKPVKNCRLLCMEFVCCLCAFSSPLTPHTFTAGVGGRTGGLE